MWNRLQYITARQYLLLLFAILLLSSQVIFGILLKSVRSILELLCWIEKGIELIALIDDLKACIHCNHIYPVLRNPVVIQTAVFKWLNSALILARSVQLPYHFECMSISCPSHVRLRGKELVYPRMLFSTQKNAEDDTKLYLQYQDLFKFLPRFASHTEHLAELHSDVWVWINMVRVIEIHPVNLSLQCCWQFDLTIKKISWGLWRLHGYARRFPRERCPWLQVYAISVSCSA